MKNLYQSISVIALNALMFSLIQAQEPAQLTNLRGSYDREVLKVNKKYITGLMSLKNSYIRSGNFEAAEQIQKEIELVQQAGIPNWVFGKWQIIGYKTPGDYFIILEGDGGVRDRTGKSTGDWIFKDKTLEIEWSNGSIDTFAIPSGKSDRLEFTRNHKGTLTKLALKRNN